MLKALVNSGAAVLLLLASPFGLSLRCGRICSARSISQWLIYRLQESYSWSADFLALWKALRTR